jgi:hypothetical protein
MLDMLILAAIGAVLVIGALSVRTLFRWACLHYRPS